LTFTAECGGRNVVEGAGVWVRRTVEVSAEQKGQEIVETCERSTRREELLDVD
jgi:hypothetical protein